MAVHEWSRPYGCGLAFAIVHWGSAGGLYTAPHSSGGLQLESKHFFVFVEKQPILCL